MFGYFNTRVKLLYDIIVTVVVYILCEYVNLLSEMGC